MKMGTERQKILVIEDDPAIRANVAELLLEEGFDVSQADNGVDGIALVQARPPDLVICDIMLPGADGYAVLRSIRESSDSAHTPVIFLTAKADRADMRAGMNLGADDYVTKPFSLGELLDAVRTRLRRSQELFTTAEEAARKATELVRSRADDSFRAPAGAIVLDPAMRALYEDAERAAATNISVLLLGETGVGKEVLARAIHDSSPRRAGPFVALNCGALPDALLESELFGHEKGAFTGALQARAGLLEAASFGTVFLDEVGELPPAIQIKLLRVLEDRRVLRVGGRQAHAIDVRFVAATNRDLEKEVERGTFREDLFYRLNGICFSIPPLRDRRSEIETLSRAFAARFSVEQGRASALGIAPECLALLESYPWPGNLRELRNAIQRGVVLCRGDVLLGEHMPPKVREHGSSAPPAQDCSMDPRVLLQRQVDDLERDRIREALDRTGGNQTLAAKLLGMSRRTLVYRLTALELPRPRKPLRGESER